MTATVIPFKRDLIAERIKLTTFDSQPTVEELHRRHQRLKAIWIETHNQLMADKMDPETFEPFYHAFFRFERYCAHYGVAPETIETFNKDRWDWNYKLPA